MKVALSTTLVATQMLYICFTQEVDITSDGENDTSGMETTTAETALQRASIYEALRSLNPNTLNLTIYWSCVNSTKPSHLSQYGEFQKNDTSYLQCKADGHLVYERSCLHNLLVASNCVDGTWDCGAQWLHSADHALSWIRQISQRYPQCFTGFEATGHYELTWDCTERCDLPCSYPKQFCDTILKSYNATVCEMECAKDSNGGRRLRQAAHDMTLEFGTSIATAAPSQSPSIGNDDVNSSTAAPPTLALESLTSGPPASSDSAHSCYWRSIIAVSIAVYALALQRDSEV
jgi:hypothetical protein